MPNAFGKPNARFHINFIEKETYHQVWISEYCWCHSWSDWPSADEGGYKKNKAVFLYWSPNTFAFSYRSQKIKVDNH